ncbi:MAG: polysaccharide deacetylase family protein [Candidatus Zipacnadales bacterium]
MDTYPVIPHALTIDVEDWAALMCMYAGQPIPVSRQFDSSIRQALDLLDQYGVRATFFVVAQHAAQRPEVVQEIAHRGHEVASHAWHHYLVGAFRPAEFQADIRRSVQTLEDITGTQVRGHRSPLFSLLPAHLWALEAMATLGLEYDSSLATLPWRRAGHLIPEQPFRFQLASGRELTEFPAIARKVGPLSIRFVGGRAARLGPLKLSIKHLEERQRSGLPGMLYVHNYEMIPDRLMAYVPRSIGLKRFPIAGAALGFQLGLGRLNRLVRILLERFTWAPMGQVLDQLHGEDRLPLFQADSPTSTTATST